MIQSIKNSFAPANKTSPEVPPVIPDYWEDSDKDKALIRSTHVCRRWREILVSRPSLWTHLDCKNLEKTKIYIERSKNFLLEIHLGGRGMTRSWEQALLLVVRHIGGLKTLSASSWQPPVTPALLQILVERFSRPIPILRTLKIDLTHDDPSLTLPRMLFNGNLSSLRELHLTAVLVPPSWRVWRTSQALIFPTPPRAIPFWLISWTSLGLPLASATLNSIT